MKIRLINEIPQNEASSAHSPALPENPARLKRAKKSWDEELAKFDPNARVTPKIEKDQEES